jgi:hypothetical protein
MKESYNEGLASHIGPESPVCVRHAQADALTLREEVGMRLTGESTGGLLSSEITSFQRQTLWAVGECNMADDVNRKSSVALAESWNLACVDTLRAGIGRSREGVLINE